MSLKQFVYNLRSSTYVLVSALTSTTLGSSGSVVNVTFRAAALSDNSSWDCLWRLPAKNILLRTFNIRLKSDWLSVSLQSANPVAIKFKRMILALGCCSKVSNRISREVGGDQ